MNHDSVCYLIVVDSRVRRKKSRGGVGVFQYAQTVENDAWDDVQRHKDIQVLEFLQFKTPYFIEVLLWNRPRYSLRLKLRQKQNGNLYQLLVKYLPHLFPASQRTTTLVGIRLFSTSDPWFPSLAFLPVRKPRLLFRCLVLSNFILLASPKVLSSKEITKKPVDFKMYDAIPTTQQSLPTDQSSEMDKFLPMLNDYLKSELRLYLVVQFLTKA